MGLPEALHSIDLACLVWCFIGFGLGVYQLGEEALDSGSRP